MLLNLILLAILTEAVIELLFFAEPLQYFRRILIKFTPSLNLKNYGHLLDCKYCISFWIGSIIYLLSLFLNNQLTKAIAFCIIVHRLSNYIHIVSSTVRDHQINLRLNR